MGIVAERLKNFSANKNALVFSTGFFLCSFCVLRFAFCGSEVVGDESLTFKDFVNEIADLQGLTYFPQSNYKLVQYSSYDRSSKINGGPNWFANADGFGNEPIPAFAKILSVPDETGVGRYLVCDIDCPGVIVRTWTARFTGIIELYLDDDSEPVYKGSAQDFFLKSYKIWMDKPGSEELFDKVFSQNDACYFPIPFSQRCKIIWQGNISEIHFYQIQIRKYSPDTQIKTITAQDVFVPKNIVRSFENPGSKANLLNKIDFNCEIEPGGKKDVFIDQGSKAVYELKLKLSAPNLEAALRQSILVIEFDDFEIAQVVSPVGDFFGMAPGVIPYRSLPFTVQGSGLMTCDFVMPFQNKVKVNIRNYGPQNIRLEGAVKTGAYKWLPQRSMYFHAKWRIHQDLIASDPLIDLPYIIALGRGCFVGTSALIMNTGNIPSGGGNWWGEGDEKIYVDNEKFPSIFGTGSEDYFNYSWGTNQIFSYPYCGQPKVDGPANRGFTVNYRWHILDKIPFDQNFSFYMELFHHDVTPGFSYATIAYYYGMPGIRDDSVFVTKNDIKKPQMPAAWTPKAALGTEGYSFYEPGSLALSMDNCVEESGWRYSEGKCLLWKPLKKDETKDFELSVPADGVYIINLTCKNSPNGGLYSVNMDKAPGIYSDKNFSTKSNMLCSRNVCLGQVDLRKGKHILTFVNQSELTGSEIGLDFIWIKRK